MACQRCTSKTAPTSPVTITKPYRHRPAIDSGEDAPETVEITQNLCGPCREKTAAVFPVKGGEGLSTVEEGEGDGSDWEHTGGGWYTNKATGEKVRGNPEEDEEEEPESEGEEPEA